MVFCFGIGFVRSARFGKDAFPNVPDDATLFWEDICPTVSMLFEYESLTFAPSTAL
jgi:hypothetical protein